MKSLFLALSLSLCSVVHAASETKPNIIFLVGDGMGVAYTSAYRFFQDDPKTPQLETTIFDEMLVGMATTYPDDHGLVTDSAAAATALASGIKTFNGAIGVDPQLNAIPSLLHKAKELGYLTGIAVTCQVNHATPAAFIAHANSRQSYEKIADQYFDLQIHGKPKVDLILGGGRDYFIRKDRNLTKEFGALGYVYKDNFKDLSKIKRLPALGLFAPMGMEPALESANPLRLAEMTEKALSLLSSVRSENQKASSFFLMLEASQIDWCGHANDIACAMGEMRDMAAAMKIIKDFVDKNPNTIFVATADHSTGGLSVGAKGQYQWNATVVRNVNATAPTIARRLLASKAQWRDEWQALTRIKLADDEQKTLDAFIMQADESKLEVVISQLTTQVLVYIDKYSSTGWTTKGHTGEDVQIFSYGKDPTMFNGAMDNTDIAKKLMTYFAL